MNSLILVQAVTNPPTQLFTSLLGLKPTPPKSVGGNRLKMGIMMKIGPLTRYCLISMLLYFHTIRAVVSQLKVKGWTNKLLHQTLVSDYSLIIRSTVKYMGLIVQ